MKRPLRIVKRRTCYKPLNWHSTTLLASLIWRQTQEEFRFHVSLLQGVQKCCREIFSWNRAWKLPWKMPWNFWWNFAAPRSSGNKARKCPELFTTNFTPFFTRRFAASNAQFHGVFHSADVCPWHVPTAEQDVSIQLDHPLCPQYCDFVLLRILAILRPLQILSPFWGLLCPSVGPWYGGVQNVCGGGGGGTYQRTRSPENFWTPPKELLVCSVGDFVQEEQSTDTWEKWKTYRRRGGPKPLFEILKVGQK